MTLPLFIRKDNRIAMAILGTIAFFFGYTLPNHFHLFQPQYLPLTQLDVAIPLMPGFIFIYLSEYVLFVSAYFLFNEELNRNRYVWCYFGVLITGMLVFIFFPTTYPRANYPLPEGLGVITSAAWLFLRTVDTPANCFPSMHVACCYLTAFSFLPKEESRKKFYIYFIWATLIAISTLPTKQHYIADVVAGLALSWIGYLVFYKRIRYVPMAEWVGRVKVKAAAWSR